MSNFDLVLKNANVLTMDDKNPEARWIGIKKGIIEALGHRDDYPQQAAQVIDIAGKTVLPGFIDSHAHCAVTGVFQFTLNLAGATSIKEILDMVEQACKQEEAKKVIIGHTLLPVNIQEGRLPTKKELDEISGDHPVMLLLWTLHGGILNSAAIAHARIIDDMEDVKKTGIFDKCDDETAFAIMGSLLNLFSDEEIAGFYHTISGSAVAAGLTTIHALDGMVFKDDRDIKILLSIKEQLPLHIVAYTQTFDLEKVTKDWNLPRIGGCLSVDGSPPQLTVALFEPYTCDPTTRGFLNYTDATLYEFVAKAHAGGIQCAFHAIGDRAIDQIIYVYDRVIKEQGNNDLRHRIEHFCMATDKHIEMAAKLGCPVQIQPLVYEMIDQPGNSQCEMLVGADRTSRMSVAPRYLAGGVVVSGSSDSPVSPMNPLGSINALVNHPKHLRRVSLTEALKMHTINGAWAAHEEKAKGSIESGKNADLVVLSKNPYEVSGKIDELISIDKTIVMGKVVYENTGN